MPALAFALLCLFWGSTWIALKLGLQVLPPVLFAGLRFAVAGGVLVGWLLLARRNWPLPRAAMRAALVPATLMIAVNYGLMAWGVARVDTGVAAILNLGTIPIAILVFAVAHGQERLSARAVAAVLFGLAGLAAMFGPTRGESGEQALPALLGGLAIVVGAACYGWGSVISKAALAGQSVIGVAAFQMALGGGLLLLASAALEAPDGAAAGRLGAPAAWGTLVYLIGVGSLLGFTVYLWLLERWPASRVANYAFVAPVVAALLGWALLDERLSLHEWAAAALLLFGAWLSMTARR